MLLRIKSLQHHTICVDISESEMVFSLKETIEKLLGFHFSTERQILLYDGVVLEDDQLISNISYDEGAFLLLICTKASDDDDCEWEAEITDEGTSNLRLKTEQKSAMYKIALDGDFEVLVDMISQFHPDRGVVEMAFKAQDPDTAIYLLINDNLMSVNETLQYKPKEVQNLEKKALGVITFPEKELQILGNDGEISIKVVRLNNFIGKATVYWRTLHYTSMTNKKLTGTTGKVILENGDTEKEFNITLSDFIKQQREEYFTIQLYNVKGASIDESNEMKVTILFNKEKKLRNVHHFNQLFSYFVKRTDVHCEVLTFDNALLWLSLADVQDNHKIDNKLIKKEFFRESKNRCLNLDEFNNFVSSLAREKNIDKGDLLVTLEQVELPEDPDNRNFQSVVNP